MKHNPEAKPLPVNEERLQSAWKASAPQPSPATMEHLREQIAIEASRHSATQLSNGIYFWPPFLAAAASLMLFAGGYMVWHRSVSANALWQELTAMEREIHNELYELEATVWDALAELEEESPSNELLLHAVTLQMMLWED